MEKKLQQQRYITFFNLKVTEAACTYIISPGLLSLPLEIHILHIVTRKTHLKLTILGSDAHFSKSAGLAFLLCQWKQCVPEGCIFSPKISSFLFYWLSLVQKECLSQSQKLNVARALHFSASSVLLVKKK